MKSRPFLTMLLVAALAVAQMQANAASQIPVVAQSGMGISAQHLATRAGVGMLKSGGNAVEVGAPTVGGKPVGRNPGLALGC